MNDANWTRQFVSATTLKHLTIRNSSATTNRCDGLRPGQWVAVGDQEQHNTMRSDLLRSTQQLILPIQTSVN